MSDKDLYENWRRAGSEEPPAALDARILAAAHAATDEGRQARRPSWIARFAPLSVAAVAVLGVALSMRVAEEEPGLRQSLPSPATPAATPPATADGARALPPAAPAEKASRQISAEVESRSERMLRDQADVGTARARESIEASRDVAVEADSAPVRSKRAAEPERRPAVPAASLREEQAAAVEPVSAAAWVVEIERLIAAGELEQARQSLRRFRRAYPAYPLPEALATLDPK